MIFWGKVLQLTSLPLYQTFVSCQRSCRDRMFFGPGFCFRQGLSFENLQGLKLFFLLLSINRGQRPHAIFVCHAFRSLSKSPLCVRPWMQRSADVDEALKWLKRQERGAFFTAHWKSSARNCYLVTSAKSAWSLSPCVCVWASEQVGAGLLNMPIHKPHRQKKKKKNNLLFLNRKNHWRINTRSERPQEQIHRPADVSMQNSGKRPDSVEKL